MYLGFPFQRAGKAMQNILNRGKIKTRDVGKGWTPRRTDSYGVRRLFSMTYIVYIYREIRRYTGRGKTQGKKPS